MWLTTGAPHPHPPLCLQPLLPGGTLPPAQNQEEEEKVWTEEKKEKVRILLKYK